MSDIVVNWPSLRQGQYFQRDLSISPHRPQKALFQETLEATSAALHDNSHSYTYEQLVDASLAIHKRFAEVYGRYCFITRLGLEILAIFGFTFVASYRKVRNELVGRLVIVSNDHIPDCLWHILSKYTAQEPSQVHISPHERAFYQKLFKKIEKALSQARNSQGFFYRVTHNGTTSYLTGTVHLATASMVAHPQIAASLPQNTYQVYTELGDHWFMRVTYALKRLNPFNPFRFGVDATLVSLARNRPNYIIALDRFEDQLTLARKVYSILAKFKEAKLMMNLGVLFCLSTWQEGREDLLTRLADPLTSIPMSAEDRSFLTEVLDNRNIKWKNVFRDYLQNPMVNRLPFSVAVGAMHLFGPTGLIQTFRDLGCTVERITT